MPSLVKPRRALEKAQKKLESLKQVDNIHDYDEIWKSFLNLYDKAWNKTENKLSEYSKYQGWNYRGKIKETRRKDPLLSYLKNARGADHHTVREITKKQPGSIRLKPGKDGSVYIKEIYKDEEKVYVVASNDIEMEFKSGNVKLLPVENRDDHYKVPEKHLGKKLDSKNPYQLGEKALRFLESYIEKAEREIL